MLLDVQEVVNIEMVGVVSDEGDGKVEHENDNNGNSVGEGKRIGSRQDDLEEGEDGVKGVLGDVAPDRELRVEGGVQQTPINDYTLLISSQHSGWE